jgi:pilus assembly protein Flp/PilA
VDFAKDEEGLALTEYLILLGLLTGGVIIAVLAIGNSLANAWGGWQTWFASNETRLSGPGT